MDVYEVQYSVSLVFADETPVTDLAKVAGALMAVLLADETVTDPIIETDAETGSVTLNVEVTASSEQDASNMTSVAFQRAMLALGMSPMVPAAAPRAEIVATA